MSAKSRTVHELDERQLMFGKVLLADDTFNITKAAKAVGLTPASAGNLVGRRYFQEWMTRELEERLKKLDMKADNVLLEAARIAAADVRDYVDWTEETVLVDETAVDETTGIMTRHIHTRSKVLLKPSADLTTDQARAISEVTLTKDGNLKIKLYPKMAALELLARAHGLAAPEKHEHVHMGVVEHTHNLEGVRERLFDKLRGIVAREDEGKVIEVKPNGEDS